jgi:hypothetical protein
MGEERLLLHGNEEEKREKKRVGTKYTLQGHATVTYFLQAAFHPDGPLSYEVLNGLTY